MKNLKKKLLVLTIIILIPFVIVGMIIAIVDPFFVYHAPLKRGYYIIDNQLEQNPGIAKHFEYDSIMLGSSMTTNFDTDMFDELLGSDMIKLSYNAAHPHDISKIMQVITEEEKALNYVFLCIDIKDYMYEPGTLSYPYPEHLYDNNVFNDLEYLLNKDVLLDYVVIPYLKKTKIKENEIYWHWQNMIYGREWVLGNYSVPEQSYLPCTQYTIENLQENLESYIIPYIEATPDTKWIVFFPPYSMLYWNNSLAANEVDIKLDGMEFITDYLMAYDNVEVFYFQDCEEWICDLNNYTDTTHYSKEVTDAMTVRLCTGEGCVTKDDYQERLKKFGRFVKNYDYEALINGNE